MSDITRETLLETHQRLKAMSDELRELQGSLATGNNSVLDRHALVMQQIRELKKTFIEQREALSTVLPNGTRLWPGQYEALERFVSNNQLTIAAVVTRIKVEAGVVTECNFSEMGLTTLTGLERLARLRKLNVNLNPKLISLKGIPTQAIDKISANQCGLAGDLSELSRAENLKDLDVGYNLGLTSLKGIPTRTIREVWAHSCGLAGDLSELSEAGKLEILCIQDNGQITSLKGIPMQAIRKILASFCFITGDHTFLSEAPNLEFLDFYENPRITVDETKFSSSVRIVL